MDTGRYAYTVVNQWLKKGRFLMKKILMICFLFLFSILAFSTHQVFAADETSGIETEKNETKTSETSVVRPDPVDSRASIGFSTKVTSGSTSEETKVKKEENSLKPIGRLPSTGELLNGGLSIAGILILFLFLFWLIKKNKKTKENN